MHMFALTMFLLILLGSIVAVILLPGKRVEFGEEEPSMKKWAALGFALAFLLAVFSVVTVVPTREIGVVTSFGRPVKDLPNGLHLVAPWQAVHTLDGTIQTDNHVGYRDRRHHGCTDIRIGNESTACIDNTIRWRIKLSAGKRLYQDYRELENIRDSLVTRELKAALNAVLSNYNPLDQIKTDAKGASADLNLFSRQVTRDLRKRVGNQVEILSVILPIIRFDSNTQSKLNSYQAQVAETRIAQQRFETAKAQAKANNALRVSVSNDPNVLVARCFDTMEEMVKRHQRIPIGGIGCWNGGAATSVVVPRG